MLDKLFCNVGKKIKIFAKVSFSVEAIASVIYGISVLLAGGLGSELGLLIMIAGLAAAWVVAIMIYGFGQLIENTDRLRTNSAPSVSKRTSRFSTSRVKKLSSKSTFQPQKKEKLNGVAMPVSDVSADEFMEEILQTETADLELILSDQQELYTPAELTYIQEVLNTRKK